MPRLGGGRFSQSYLIDRGEGSTTETETMTSDDAPPMERRAVTSVGALVGPPSFDRLPLTNPMSTKSASTSSFRSSGYGPIPDKIQLSPRRKNRRTIRAVEKGRGSVLPEWSGNLPSRSSSFSTPVLRARAQSDDKGSTSVVTACSTSSGNLARIPSLRRRYGGEEDDGSSGSDPSRERHSRAPADPESPYRPRSRSRWPSIDKLMTMKLGHFLQIMTLLTIAFLVWDSNNKAAEAAQRLDAFKEGDSLLALHMQRIEQQSIQLHEYLEKVSKNGGNLKAASAPQEVVSPDVESLIRKQTQQLYQMEEEISHEVRSLQGKIQQSSRSRIVQEFGEGPVQVVLDLDLPGEGPSQIAILLFYETPHAAWTLLDQVQRNIWQGAEFRWKQSHTIAASPVRTDPARLEFIEKPANPHQPWTVGLTESTGSGIHMFINLQDNSKDHQHDACVGKVIDGFDALQRLLENSKGVDENQSGVAIKSAIATHVARRDEA